MIPIAHFMPFAALNCTVRESLSLPRLVGDRIVATNGRVIVHALVTEIIDDPSDPCVEVPNFPFYQRLFEGITTDSPAEIPPLPPRPEDQACSKCHGSGIITCPTCDQDHNCQTCKGTGWIHGKDTWFLILADQRYNAHHLDHIAKLPNVKFYHCQVGLYFTFGESGHGIISRLALPEKE